MKKQNPFKAMLKYIYLPVFIIFSPTLRAQSFTATIQDLYDSNNKCAGFMVYMNAHPYDLSLYTYEWTCPNGNCPGNPNSPGSPYVPNQGFMADNSFSYNGLWVLKVTEIATGDTAIASSIITTNPTPVVYISPDINSGCAGTPMAVTASDGSGLYGPYTYSWINSNGGAVVCTTQVFNTYIGSTVYPFQYNVLITNQYGCSTYNQYYFMVNGSPVPTISITAAGPTAFCAGENVSLQAAVNYDTSTVTLHWKKYSNSLANTDFTTYTATSTGKYRCVATIDQSGCSSTSNFIEVTSNPLPSVSVQPTGPVGFCLNQSVTLQSLSPTAVSWQWKKYSNILPNDTLSSLTVNKKGKYKVIVTDANGCSRASVPVEVIGPPNNQLTISNSLNLCPGDSVTFTAAPGYSYQWRQNSVDLTGDTLQSYTATTTGKYKVMVTNDYNCTIASKAYQVNVSPIYCTPTVAKLNHAVVAEVFPIPFTNELNIALPDQISGDATVELFDLSGKLLLTYQYVFENGQPASLQTGTLSPGVYLLKVSSTEFIAYNMVIRK